METDLGRSGRRPPPVLPGSGPSGPCKLVRAPPRTRADANTNGEKGFGDGDGSKALHGAFLMLASLSSHAV